MTYADKPTSAFDVLGRIDFAGADEPDSDITDEVNAAVRELKGTLRDLVALVHAINGGHVSRNPYVFPALQRANIALTGTIYECGFSLPDAVAKLAETRGRETGLKG